MGLEDNIVVRALVKLHTLEVCEKGYFVTESFAKTKRLAEYKETSESIKRSCGRF